MRYHAIYQDDRDDDESAIAECTSVDDAVDAVVRYFRRMPNQLEHMTYWAVVDDMTGDYLLKTGSLDLS